MEKVEIVFDKTGTPFKNNILYELFYNKSDKCS